MIRLLIPSLLIAGCALGSCQSIARAEAAAAQVTFPGVARLHVGKIQIDWMALKGSINQIDLLSLRGPLKSGSVELFEDLNRNGFPDAGEVISSATSTNSGDGIRITNLTLGAGDLVGRDPERMRIQFKVIDINGNAHIHCTNL